MSAGRPALDAPLPTAVAAANHAPWNRYRRYPVFSLPWLRGRSLLFAAAIGGWSLLSLLGVRAAGSSTLLGVLAGLHMFIAFMVMSTVGPGLATWVRHRRWPLPRERRWVVVSILVGVVLGFLADAWASPRIDALMEQALDPQTAQLAEVTRERMTAAEERLAWLVGTMFALALYALFGGGLALRAYFGEHRRWQASVTADELAQARRRQQRSELRLGVLQAQVEPHFLFNTLASVRALVRQDPGQAEATLDALVKHLRATIPKLRGEEDVLDSTLGQQLDICASYLELMRLRLGGRLEYAVHAAPALRDQPFPPLLLITLVENAIKHGIEPRPGPGRVELHAALEGGLLRVRVTDDGAGLKPGLGSGMGLANVREQLAARYGRRAGMSLQNRAAGGVEVTLHVPAAGDRA